MAAIQNNDSYIGQLLIKDGIITRDELDRGLAEQKKNREFLCSNLVRLGLASEERIFSILSLQIGVPFLSLTDTKIDPAVLGCIPGSFALACNCMPLKIIDGVFYIAMADPMNTRAVKEIKSDIGFEKVKIFLSGDADIRNTIGKYYGV